jgi:hypothetical protein
MRVLERLVTISGIALVALSLGAARHARAGDGGADLGGLQTYINDVCGAFGMSTCPQIPTISQAVLQVAAFVDIAPEKVRSSTSFAVAVGPYVDAGNPSRPPAINCVSTSCVDPLNPIAGLPIDPGVLSSLRPLAFVGASNSNGAASPTQLYDPSANAFLYAVGGTSTTGSSQPNTLTLFYDDPTRTNTFSRGQIAASISLPLTVLSSDGTERAVSATLQIKMPKAGAAPCSASSVTGDFLGSAARTLSPDKVGIDCAVVFGASPVQPLSHAIFEVTVPMLITPGNDPAITAGSPIGFGAPFFGTSGFAFAPGKSVGIGPNAGPFGPPATTRATYALCASLPTNAGGNALLPSVAAFYAIAGDGEVLLSAPLAPSISIGCPAM